MLPKPLHDKKIRFFKFWFNHQMQDGLYYQNELFYRFKTIALAQRTQLYRLGQHLVQQGADVLVTSQADQASLWVSLRSHPKVLAQLRQLLPLPSVSSRAQSLSHEAQLAATTLQYAGQKN